jgi:hypothetical protein
VVEGPGGISVRRAYSEALGEAANDGLAESLPTKHDLARYFNVSVRTIDRWTRSKLIPSIKFGPRITRYHWGAVQRAVARLVIQEIK